MGTRAEASPLPALLGSGARCVPAGPAVLSFLTTLDGNALRATCRALRATAAAHPWADASTPVLRLAPWRACYPAATAANVSSARGPLSDAEVALLCGATSLDLSRRDVSDAQLRTLAAAARAASARRGLHTLDIYGCARVSAAGLRALAGVHTLRAAHCGGVCDGGLAALAGIHTLDVSGCARVGDAGLAALAGVRVLLLRGCGGVSDAGVAAAAAGGALRELSVAGCGQLGDAAFVAAAAGGGLTALDASGSRIGAEGLAAVLGRCAGTLDSLTLVACDALDDAALEALRGARALRRLVLADCTGFSAKALLRALPGGLAHANVHGCRQLPRDAIDALAGRVRRLTVHCCDAAPAPPAGGAAGDGGDDDDSDEEEEGDAEEAVVGEEAAAAAAVVVVVGEGVGGL